MMVVCAIADCQNSAENEQLPNTSFYPFPLEELLLAQWLCFCGQNDGVNIKTAKICSLHFKKDDFENLMKYEMGFAKKLKLKKGAAPTAHVKNDDNRGNKSPAAMRLQVETLTKDIDDMKKKISDLHRENFILKTAETDFKKEINSLRLEVARSQFMKRNFEEKLRKVFSTGQIRQLMNDKRVIWSEEDIAKSIALYSVSHRAYKLLMKMQFPFPAVRTLLVHQKRVKDKIAEEINNDNADA